MSALHASPIHNQEFNYYLKGKLFKWYLGFPSVPAYRSSSFRVNQIYCKEVSTHKYICSTSGNNSRTYPRAVCATSDFCCLHSFRIQPWVRRQHSVLLCENRWLRFVGFCKIPGECGYWVSAQCLPYFHLLSSTFLIFTPVFICLST